MADEFNCLSRYSDAKPDECSELAAHVGHELITTDGTTLLGADDKAGVAEIMAAVTAGQDPMENEGGNQRHSA